ncbi:unnamed protein product [Pipistrellus nathusii]|uniref:Beta-defensin n=1 Tax=Pipistrellus nathusii TaxID=59473 RepID=A0ABP0A8R9_PIPNA
MKILLFSFILFFFGVFMLSASRKVDPFAFNRSEICVLLSGQCKRQCGEKEFRMVYCVIPTVFCCIRECEPYEYY